MIGPVIGPVISAVRAMARGVRDDRRGVALIEFAMVLPVLLLLFLGGYQLSDASACKRKVTITARALADITSQYTTLTKSEADTVLAAAQQIMAPYDLANAEVRVSQITLTSTGKKGAKIVWSRARNTTERAVNSVVTEFPADLRLAKGDTYIYAEVSYNYDPKIGNLVPPVSFEQTLYMLPRKSAKVTLQ